MRNTKKTMTSLALIPEELIDRITELVEKIADGTADIHDLDEFGELWREAINADRLDS